ncbi:MAG: tail fiber assembly protein [Bacteroidota bacterium]|nr:tail fiber assembly protein [Bacteroidota bacterium]
MERYDWAMCDQHTGEIQYITRVTTTSKYSHAGVYNDMLTFQVDSDSDHVKLVEETYYDYTQNQFLPRSKRPNSYYKWTSDKQWVLNTEMLMRELRQKRLEKLALCEWTQVADSPLTDEKKAEWATYRQALRDVPQNLDDDFGDLEGFVWPIEPS